MERTAPYLADRVGVCGTGKPSEEYTKREGSLMRDTTKLHRRVDQMLRVCAASREWVDGEIISRRGVTADTRRVCISREWVSSWRIRVTPSTQ